MGAKNKELPVVLEYMERKQGNWLHGYLIEHWRVIAQQYPQFCNIAIVLQ